MLTSAWPWRRQCGTWRHGGSRTSASVAAEHPFVVGSPGWWHVAGEQQTACTLTCTRCRAASRSVGVTRPASCTTAESICCPGCVPTSCRLPPCRMHIDTSISPETSNDGASWVDWERYRSMICTVSCSECTKGTRTPRCSSRCKLALGDGVLVRFAAGRQLVTATGWLWPQKANLPQLVRSPVAQLGGKENVWWLRPWPSWSPSASWLSQEQWNVRSWFSTEVTWTWPSLHASRGSTAGTAPSSSPACRFSEWWTCRRTCGSPCPSTRTFPSTTSVGVFRIPGADHLDHVRTSHDQLQRHSAPGIVVQRPWLGTGERSQQTFPYLRSVDACSQSLPLCQCCWPVRQCSQRHSPGAIWKSSPDNCRTAGDC